MHTTPACWIHESCLLIQEVVDEEADVVTPIGRQLVSFQVARQVVLLCLQGPQRGPVHRCHLHTDVTSTCSETEISLDYKLILSNVNSPSEW